jgi:bifunctional DNA-binding transcriptional regulator/antitoxin component of YhaV-PrlF toxin-antitoxin module
MSKRSKTHYFTARLDSQCRVTVPKAIRSQENLGPGDFADFTVTRDKNNSDDEIYHRRR